MRCFIVLSIMLFILCSSSFTFSQCNTNTIVCDNTGATGPFNFDIASPNPSSCLDFINGANSNNYAYITLFISAPGQLNLLVNGSSTTGFLDVAVFDITNLTDPCSDMSEANELSCNYASAATGCAQFGTQFPCQASIPAPNVAAGDMIMILVEDWSNSNTSFTLELSDNPGSAVSSRPDATIDPAGPFCMSNAPIQLTAANMGGVWSGASVTSSGLFDPAVAGPGTHTIDYGIGTAPCEDSDQLQITVFPSPVVNAEIQGGGNSITICEGDSVDIEANGASTYYWDNGLGAGATHTVSPGSITTYTAEGTDANGCVDTDIVTVYVSPEVIVDASPDVIICATTSTVIEAVASGGTTFDYNWSHTSDGGGIQTVTPSNSENIYTVYAENEFGCESESKSIVIDWYPEPTGIISEDQSICFGEFVDLSVSASGGSGGPYTFSWTDPSGTIISDQESVNVNPTATGTYEVEVNDNCGVFPKIMSVEVVVNPLPEVGFSVDLDNQCVPATFEITNETDSSLVEETYWYLSDGQTIFNMDNFEVSIDQAGTYDLSLVVVTPYGCVDSVRMNDFLTVYSKPNAKFNFIPDPVTMMNTEVFFRNYSTGADSYQWYFEDGDPDYSSLTDPVSTFPEGVVEDYDVELIAASIHDCKDTVRAIIQVKSEATIYAPNAFTPDNDEHNPRWRVYIDGIDIEMFDLEIYNRWGEMIWESHNPEIGWDGTYGAHSGRKVEDGTYVWKVRARDFVTDKKYEWRGHVTILY